MGIINLALIQSIFHDAPGNDCLQNQFKKAGLLRIEERITITKLAIANAQEAANSQDKSSAGDKYETGRAMGHLEKDMYARQHYIVKFRFYTIWHNLRYL